MTFRFAGAPASRVTVRPGQHEDVVVDALDGAYGWYRVTATVDGVGSFSRRFAGHLENGQPSRTG